MHQPRQFGQRDDDRVAAGGPGLLDDARSRRSVVFPRLLGRFVFPRGRPRYRLGGLRPEASSMLARFCALKKFLLQKVYSDMPGVVQTLRQLAYAL